MLTTYMHMHIMHAVTRPFCIDPSATQSRQKEIGTSLFDRLCAHRLLLSSSHILPAAREKGRCRSGLAWNSILCEANQRTRAMRSGAREGPAPYILMLIPFVFWFLRVGPYYRRWICSVPARAALHRTPLVQVTPATRRRRWTPPVAHPAAIHSILSTKLRDC